MNAHRATAHIKVVCEPCRETVYEEDLVIHYTNSTSGNHPKCSACEIGCKDEIALEEHARTHIQSSILDEETHGDGLMSNSSPTSTGDTASLSLKVPSPTASPSKRFPLLETASPINPNVYGVAGPGSGPRSQQPLDIPIAGQGSDASAMSTTTWGANGVPFLPAKPWGHLPKPLIRKDLLVQGELRTDTPPLRLSTSFSSPIMEVEQPGNLYSPASNLAPPSPELNKAWKTKANLVTTDTTKISTSASLASSSNALITGPKSPWTTASPERRLSGLGELQWRKSAYSGSQPQPVGPTLGGESSTSSWLNSRLRLREPATTSNAATQPSDTSESWITTLPAKSHHDMENTIDLAGTRDVVKWRAILGDEVGDVNETPRTLFPVKAKIEEMELAKLQPASQEDKRNRDSGDETSDSRAISVPAVGRLQERVVALPGGNRSAESSESSENGRALEVDSPTTTVSTSRSSYTAPMQSPLHCRQCKTDSCDDITATMCGHLFCYRCITSAVIATSKCPVCSTPTLLYCLFKLDLSA